MIEDHLGNEIQVFISMENAIPRFRTFSGNTIEGGALFARGEMTPLAIRTEYVGG
jgi:hypothetical protein